MCHHQVSEMWCYLPTEIRLYYFNKYSLIFILMVCLFKYMHFMIIHLFAAVVINNGLPSSLQQQRHVVHGQLSGNDKMFSIPFVSELNDTQADSIIPSQSFVRSIQPTTLNNGGKLCPLYVV